MLQLLLIISSPKSLRLLQRISLLESFSSYYCCFRLIAKNYALLRRSLGSKQQSFYSRDLVDCETLNRSPRQQGRELIFLINYFQFLHYHGVIPVNSSQKITPIEKMSLKGEQIFFTSAYNGIQSGVPTLYRVFTSTSEKIAKPKSAIFQFLRLLRMFAGLRSLWSTPLLRRYLTPSMISVMIWMATVSSSFPRRVRQLRRSPLEQSSVMMQQLLAVLQMSKHLITLGWSSDFKIWISLSSIFKLCSLYFFSSITLTAHYRLSLQPYPLQTLLLQPEPISCPRSQVQFPMLRSEDPTSVELQVLSLLVEPTCLRRCWEGERMLRLDGKCATSGEKCLFRIQNYYFVFSNAGLLTLPFKGMGYAEIFYQAKLQITHYPQLFWLIS